MQNELGERRGKWMAILQEFDLEIQPMKLVRGQGLAKLISHTEQAMRLVSCSYTHEGVIFGIGYQDIVYYLLQDTCLNGMNSS